MPEPLDLDAILATEPPATVPSGFGLPGVVFPSDAWRRWAHDAVPRLVFLARAQAAELAQLRRVESAATVFLAAYECGVASGDWGEWDPHDPAVDPEACALRRVLRS